MAFGPLCPGGHLLLGKDAQTRPLQANAEPRPGTNRALIGFPGRQKGPKLTFYAVSLHGATYRPPNGIANMGGGKRWIDHHRTPQTTRANICSLFGESGEDLPLANSADQAESR